MRAVRMRLALALCALAWPCGAQKVDCGRAAAQVGLTFCAEQNWRAAEVALSAACRAALAVMKRVNARMKSGARAGGEFLAPGAARLGNFPRQRLRGLSYWLQDGSAEAMVIHGCRARLTEARTLGLYYLSEQVSAD